MENVHAERSAGWSVLCYVGVLVLATFLNNGMPPLGLAPDRYGAHHRYAPQLSLLLAAWLTFPAAAFFLWFLVGLRSYLGERARPSGRPSDVRAGCRARDGRRLALGGRALQIAASTRCPTSSMRNGLAGIYDAFIFTQGGLGYAPVSIFLFAAAHSMRRHESRARDGLRRSATSRGCGAAIASLSIFFTDSFMAPGATRAGPLGALPTAIWLIATGHRADSEQAQSDCRTRIRGSSAEHVGSVVVRVIDLPRNLADAHEPRVVAAATA